MRGGYPLNTFIDARVNNWIVSAEGKRASAVITGMRVVGVTHSQNLMSHQ